MRFSSGKRLLNVFLAIVYLMVSVFASVPRLAWGQADDLVPPVVNLQPVDEGIIGENQIFTVSVTDNENISVVLLHFRFDGESAYVAREMMAQSGTDVYTTTIEMNNSGEDINSIQYFIEAKDSAGNRTLQGFAFDPIVRLLVTRNLAVNDAANGSIPGDSGTTLFGGMSTGQKVLLGLFGVVVVGALASAASSGGSGDSEPGVDLIVTVDPIQ